MGQKVILDVDTGGDDAAAILLAGHHPALDLMAVTVTHGNAPLDITLDNTLRVMQAGELEDIPVFCGADRPLLGIFAPAKDIQKVRLDLPKTNLTVQNRRAVEFLIEYYLSDSGPDTLYMPLGPHTNLALALRLEPALVRRIPRIVTMGGAYLEGNTTPSAEFNILADPEAASIVFNSGIPITMVGLEVTKLGLVTPDDVKDIRALKTPWAIAAAQMMDNDVRWFVDRLGWEGGQIFDACAVAAVIEPDVLKTKPMWVDVELHGGLTRGRTVADVSGFQPRQPNVDVGVDFNRKKFIQILLEGLK